MLVLSRKVGERITIGDNVQIIVTRVAGGRVTIGIDAPMQVSVRRDEIVPRLPESSRRFDVPLSLDELALPSAVLP
ncbi:MAG: carbon storage regulator [Rubripirellula sp.]